MLERILLISCTSFTISTASAAQIYSTDYTTQSDGFTPFNAGELRFQDGWLGQTSYTVDPTGSGTVTYDSSSNGFLRTLQNRGALGGTAGGDGSGESSLRGFVVGDQINITYTGRYELTTDPNQPLSLIGVRSDFVNSGFEAAPTNGFEVAYSSFGDGNLKVFTNFARSGSNGSDNAFALFVSGTDAGFDGANQGQIDTTTDNLEFDYSAVFDGTGWLATELIVRNVDNSTLIAQASVDNPDALESVAYSGTEAFFGQQLILNSGPTAISDGMSFSFTAVPEPSAYTLLSGLLVIGYVLKRRR